MRPRRPSRPQAAVLTRRPARVVEDDVVDAEVVDDDDRENK